MYCKAIFLALLTLRTIPSAVCQTEPSSVLDRTQCKFQDHTDVTVEYRSIEMKGRKIFGGLVPYDRVWVTGNKLTPTLVTSANLIIGGKSISAGYYSLSTIPYPDKWTMFLQRRPSKESLEQVGEATRIDLAVRRLHSPLEGFTISFDQVNGGCVLNLRWEQTEASVLLAERK